MSTPIPDFAAIITVCDRQVLLYKTASTADQPIVQIRYLLPNGVSVAMALNGFPNEAARDSAFERVKNGDLAVQLVSHILHMDAKIGKPEDVEPSKIVLPAGVRRRRAKPSLS